MSYGLGVDLGTSFIRAATSRGGHPRMVVLDEQSVLVPSAVRVRSDGQVLLARESDDDPARQNEDAVGRDFKRRLGDPTPLIVGGQPHSAVSLLAAGLRQVFDTVCALEESPPQRLTLTYPAVWGPYRREQFAEVPRRAGIDPDIVTVITEPEAAALYHATRGQLPDGDVVAVYDLGGGTFDTAVTRVSGGHAEILGVPEGVEWLGGVDFDDAVLGFVDRALDGAVSALNPDDPVAAVALHRLKRECVAAKERLTRMQITEIAVLLPRRHTSVPITRRQFEELIRTPLEASVAAVERALKSTGLTGADLAAVLLVGGSSRIPLVATMLGETLGRPVMVDPYPQHCVALGAAAHADPAGVRTAGPPVSGPGPAPARTVGRRRRLLVLGLVTVLAAVATIAGVCTFAIR